MRWHVEWLLRLAAEFYLVKRQAHQLQVEAHLQLEQLEQTLLVNVRTAVRAVSIACPSLSPTAREATTKLAAKISARVPTP